MGYPERLFQSVPVPKQYKCPICLDVLQNPITCDPCECTFCAGCIQVTLNFDGLDSFNNSLDQAKQCPHCQEQLEQLKPSLSQFCTILNNLQLRCSFDECDLVVSLKQFDNHRRDCRHNPKNAPLPCPKSCGAEIRRNQEHSCLEFVKNRHESIVEKLKQDLQHKSEELDAFQQVSGQQTEEIATLKDDRATLRNEIETLNVKNKQLDEIVNQQTNTDRPNCDQQIWELEMNKSKQLNYILIKDNRRLIDELQKFKQQTNNEQTNSKVNGEELKQLQLRLDSANSLNRRLSSKIEALEHKNCELNEQNECLAKKLQDQEKKYQLKSDKNRQLINDMKELEDYNESLADQCRKLNTEMEKLQALSDLFKEQNQQLKVELLKSRKSNESKVEFKNKPSINQIEEIKQLQLQLKTANEEIDKLKAQNQEYSNENEKLIIKLEYLKDDYQFKSDKLSLNEKRLNEAIEEKNLLEQKLRQSIDSNQLLEDAHRQLLRLYQEKNQLIERQSHEFANCE